VYVLYNRILKNWGYTPAGMLPFLEGLAAIPRDVEVQCSMADARGQGREDALGSMLRRRFNGRRAPSGFALLPRESWSTVLQVARAAPKCDLVEELAFTFFHYRANLGGSKLRIYLNVKAYERHTVMAWVVGNVLPLAGCSNAKVGGPGPEHRADSIVMYFSDQAAVDQALALLRGYQRGNRRRFLPGVPRMVREIQGLEGVGVGAEPEVALQAIGSRLYMREGSSSFGTYRSQLVEHALHRTLRRNEDRDAFVDRALRYFREAGVDVAHPDRHTDIDRLRQTARAIEQRIARGERPSRHLGIGG
jgi:hypothetical protein